MKSIATVAAVICVAALGCSLVNVVAPQGSTKKILNTVLGAFILCSLLVPIKNAITDFNVNISIAPPGEDLSVVADIAYNKAIMAETKASLESTLIAYLETENCPVENVEIQLSSYDNGGIYISTISIYISKEYNSNAEKVISLTKKKFEVEPHIILR